MGRFKEHGVMLYLSPELYIGFVKLQADKGLGRSYAALLSFTEGLHKLGYVSKASYEIHKKKYSQPLVQKKVKPMTIEELEEQEKIRQFEKIFSDVIRQWPTLHKKARQSHLKNAKKYLDKVSNAKFVLALENGDIEGEVTT